MMEASGPFGTRVAIGTRGDLPACTAFIPFPKDSAPTQIRPPPALLSPARPCPIALKLIDEITANVYIYHYGGPRFFAERLLDSLDSMCPLQNWK